MNELDGKSPFIVLHRDAVGINDDYKPKKALISKILSIADSLDSDKSLKED
jgi:hypothetical protein